MASVGRLFELLKNSQFSLWKGESESKNAVSGSFKKKLKEPPVVKKELTKNWQRTDQKDYFGKKTSQGHTKIVQTDVSPNNPRFMYVNPKP
jgi:hypothetical protein